ncbi:MAG: selenide, water dikinase SelD [Lacibacter sp.]
MEENTIRLTQFSHGGGCGCKIAPAVLEQILHSTQTTIVDKNLLVGNSSKDDAAVYDLGNGTGIVSTTDFFMPIVDDAFEFGKIASANSISDVYAMGGKPLMAIAVLGWPVNKLSADVAQKVLDGSRAICTEAGIPLAGGHSIDSPEPFFGLAVTGLVDLKNLKQNNTAQEGNVLLLTKSIGVGILTTAGKRSLLKEEHKRLAPEQMMKLNKTGEELGKLDAVTAMTDVTGFGLLGHAIEMTEGSGLSAEIYYSKIPFLEPAKEYAAQRIMPDATTRNWNSYSSKVAFGEGVNVMEAFNLLPDPQTNGGLLIAVKEEALEKVQHLLVQNGLSAYTEPIGKLVSKQEKVITILP